MNRWRVFLCLIGRHDWAPWALDDGEGPIIRLESCTRCGAIAA